MKTFAQIKDSKVINVIIWDGVSEFTVDDDLVEIPKGAHAGINWDYIDGKFVDNRPQPTD